MTRFDLRCLRTGISRGLSLNLGGGFPFGGPLEGASASLESAMVVVDLTWPTWLG